MLHIAMYLFYLAPLINLRLHYTGSIIAAFFSACASVDGDIDFIQCRPCTFDGSHLAECLILQT